jgi:predicted amidohydrolase
VLQARSRAQQARLVVFPELFLSGYELPLLARDEEARIARDDARLDPVRRACACSTGEHVSCGPSGVWAPSGEIVRRAAGSDEEMIVVDLDRAALAVHRGA